MARNTVIDAYEQLTAEGYLETRRGSGTYVARQLPDRSFEAPPPARANGKSPHLLAPIAELRLSPFGTRVVTGQAPILMGRSMDNAPHEFRYGTPSLDEFPLDVWKTLTKRVFEYQRQAEGCLVKRLCCREIFDEQSYRGDAFRPGAACALVHRCVPVRAP